MSTYTSRLFGRAPTIAVHGVNNNTRGGAPVHFMLPVAKMTRPGTPETASPAVEGPKKIRIETEGTENRHPCAMAGPKQTREKCADTWGMNEQNAHRKRQNATVGHEEWTYTSKTEIRCGGATQRSTKRHSLTIDQNAAAEGGPSKREQTTATQQQNTKQRTRRTQPKQRI